MDYIWIMSQKDIDVCTLMFVVVMRPPDSRVCSGYETPDSRVCSGYEAPDSHVSSGYETP